MEEFHLITRDRTVLRVVLAPVENPRGVVFVAHGLGEHILRYQEIFRFFHRLSIYALGLDHRGHGASSGQRGHIGRFSEYVDDFMLLYEHLSIPKEVPWFQFGHSMGGLIAIHLILKAVPLYPGRFRGLILSAPLLKIAAEVPPWKARLGEIASRYLPRLSMDNGIDPSLLSHDEKVVQAYVKDPLVHRRVTARWYTEILGAMESAHRRAGEISLPVLLLHGTEDRLTDPSGSEEFARSVKGPLTFHRLEGYYHEVFHEDSGRRERSYDLLSTWLTQVLEKGS
jgi:alpha-beta hydrolase superfamily lysophospholipase